MASILLRPCHRAWPIHLAIALGLCGCGGGKKAPAVDAAPTSSADVELQVVNRHWLDVTIYVMHDGQLTRVGVAPGSGNTQILLSSRLVGAGRELRLYGDPIGSPERAVTEIIVVQPGQYIEWLLESELDRSTVGVY